MKVQLYKIIIFIFLLVNIINILKVNIYMLQKRGNNIVLSSASGVGKSMIIKNILQNQLSNIEFSISYTSRPKRESETIGKDYHFISKDEFENMIKNNQFIEYTQLYGNYYGTSFIDLDGKLKVGKSIIFDINWHGGEKLKQLYPQETITIFILPPSINELINRINKRSEDNTVDINIRISKAKHDLMNCLNYEYVVVNDDIQVATDNILNIIEASIHKRSLISNLQDVINSM